jgi:hypothetical protein
MSVRKVGSPACHEERGTSRISVPVNYKVLRNEGPRTVPITYMPSDSERPRTIAVSVRHVPATEEPRTITVAVRLIPSSEEPKTIAGPAKTIADMKALAATLLAQNRKIPPGRE